MYRNLNAEIARNGLTKMDLAKYLGVRSATVYDKMKGKYSFTLDEAFRIKKKFFPDLELEYLFERDVESENHWTK